MNHITAWVEALESGEYEQTEKTLFDGSGYCCLGVAACVLVAAGENLEWMDLYLIGKDENHDDVLMQTELDTERLKTLGISSQDQSKFMNMNDEYHNGFKEIAAEIRRMFPEEF